MKKLINPWTDTEGYNCFGCAENNPSGLQMEFYEDGDYILSKWKPRPQFQGWLNTLHGGIQSVMLDEIAAWTLICKLQLVGVTSKMETRFLKSVRTNDSFILLKGRVFEVKRNIVTINAELYDSHNKLCTKSKVTFFTFSKDKSESEMFFSGFDTEVLNSDL